MKFWSVTSFRILIYNVTGNLKLKNHQKQEDFHSRWKETIEGEKDVNAI